MIDNIDSKYLIHISPHDRHCNLQNFEYTLEFKNKNDDINDYLEDFRANKKELLEDLRTEMHMIDKFLAELDKQI